jgi:hypothetical protein
MTNNVGVGDGNATYTSGLQLVLSKTNVISDTKYNM